MHWSQLRHDLYDALKHLQDVPRRHLRFVAAALVALSCIACLIAVGLILTAFLTEYVESLKLGVAAQFDHANDLERTVAILDSVLTASGLHILHLHLLFVIPVGTMPVITIRRGEQQKELQFSLLAGLLPPSLLSSITLTAGFAQHGHPELQELENALFTYALMIKVRYLPLDSHQDTTDMIGYRI